MTKRIFNAIFIIFTAIALIALNEFDLLQALLPFSFLPIIFAFVVGQYSERRFKS